MTWKFTNRWEEKDTLKKKKKAEPLELYRGWMDFSDVDLLMETFLYNLLEGHPELMQVNTFV